MINGCKFTATRGVNEDEGYVYITGKDMDEHNFRALFAVEDIPEIIEQLDKAQTDDWTGLPMNNSPGAKRYSLLKDLRSAVAAQDFSAAIILGAKLLQHDQEHSEYPHDTKE